MKKAFLILMVMFLGTAVAVAQEQSEIATSKGKEALTVSKSSGEFLFTLPATVMKEDVDKAAGFYTHYFTVKFDAASHATNIKMVEGQTSTYVIARFLTACGVRYISVDGQNLDLSTFIEEYLER